jgi:RNA polymerase sigma factor (sigma-70 family)
MEHSEVEGLTTVEVGRMLERSRPLLYAICLRWAGRRSVAEELVQETMLAALSSLDRLAPTAGSFRRWLVGVARRVCTDAGLRPRAGEVLTLDAEQEDTAPSALDRVLRREQRRIVSDAVMAACTSEEQAALFLRGEGRSYDEIERTLSPRTPARMLIARSRRRLLQELHERGLGLDLLGSDST